MQLSSIAIKYTLIDVVTNFGQFVKYSRNTWKVFNFGIGEGWRISVGPIVWGVM